MSKEVDHDEAAALLRETWREITDSDESAYVDEYVLQQGLRRVLHADKYGTRTFKYILVTNVLAKAVNPDIHAIALQDQSDLDGSFNSGGLATDVVTDWEKDNGERLGCSNEPRTNSVYYRQSELNEDYTVRNEEIYQTLIRILKELQSRVADGTLDPLDMLRQTLYEVSRLEPTTVSYTNPPNVSYAKLAPVVREYLTESGLGERLAAVTAGVLDAQYFVADRTRVTSRSIASTSLTRTLALRGISKYSRPKTKRRCSERLKSRTNQPPRQISSTRLRRQENTSSTSTCSWSGPTSNPPGNGREPDRRSWRHQGYVFLVEVDESADGLELSYQRIHEADTSE
jgi:hypothetical protein